VHIPRPRQFGHLRILKMFITLSSDAELSVSNKQNPASIDSMQHFPLLVPSDFLAPAFQMFLILGIILLIIWLVLWLGVHAASAAVHIFIALAMISFLLHFVRGTPERR
jgi:Flp pilus assembly protein TadB